MTRTSSFALACAVLLASGEAAADSWGPETNLSGTATDSETGLNHRPMAVTAGGILHVVWAEKDAPNQNYRVKTRRLESGGWTGTELIVDYLVTDPGTGGGAKYPSLATAADGTLHVFWHDYRIAGINNVEIFTKVRPVGGAWDTSRAADVRLTTTSHTETGGDNGYVPVPVAAAGGDVHVLWYDFRFDGSHAEILAKTLPAGGAWNVTPGDAADDRVTSDPDNSELVAADVDAAGNVHAAWRSVGTGILYARRDAATGAWSAPVAVDLAGSAAGAPALAVDGPGTVHVVWPDSREGNRALWTRARSAAGAWDPQETRLTPPPFVADEPSLAAAPDGTLHLVWHDGRGSILQPEVFHREKPAGSPWDTTSALDFRVSLSMSNAVRPSVLATSTDVYVLWKDARDGNNEVYFRRRSPAATGAPVSASTRETLLAFPNPSRGAPVRFLPATGAASSLVEILDLAGRRIRRLPPGAAWDTRDALGVPVPAGVYFVRSGGARSTRITVLR